MLSTERYFETLYIETHKNFQKLQEDYNALKKLAIGAGLICARCEGTGKLVRNGRKDLGEPNIVYSDCRCKVEKQ